MVEGMFWGGGGGWADNSVRGFDEVVVHRGDGFLQAPVAAAMHAFCRSPTD
jgi:hypothetical protein